MTRIAHIISTLFHPLFMPLIGLALVYNSCKYIEYSMDGQIARITFLTVFIFTVLLPALNIYFMAKKGMISSPQLHKREERHLPYLMYTISFVLLYYFLKPLLLPPVIYLIVLGSIFVSIAALMINFRWKISAHMMGIGGATGTVTGVAMRFSEDLTLLVMGMFLCAGLVGFARLQLNAHSSGQVYAGFLLSFFSLLIFIVY